MKNTPLPQKQDTPTPQSQPVSDSDANMQEIATRPSLVGTNLDGHYEILESLGVGGMGEVYKARHLLMDRVVAIKVLLPHLAQDMRCIRRFQQEAIAAARLDHENICRILEFKSPEDTSPYLVMDFLDGVPLSTILSKATLSIDRIVNISCQIASALKHAHSSGILHRDLKPSNIVVLNTQDGDIVKIVDFGIARILSDNPDHRLTRKGVIVGSPVYMSPEQCRAQDVDQLSDMYSLGCVMYEMIAGHPPFRSSTSLETIQKHNNDLPKSPAAHRKGCPAQLEQIVMRCLEKRREDRFASTKELHAALVLLQSQISNPRKSITSSQSEGHVSESADKKLKEQHSKMMALYVITAMALMLAAVLVTSKQNNRQVPTVETPTNAPIGGKSSDAQSEWKSLYSHGLQAFDSGKLKEAEVLLQKAQAVAASSFPNDRRRTTTLNALLDLHHAMGRKEDDQSTRSLQADINQLTTAASRSAAPSVVPFDSSSETIDEYVATCNDLAAKLIDRGDFHEALATLHPASKLLKQLPPDNINAIRTLLNSCDIYIETNDDERAAAISKRLEQLCLSSGTKLPQGTKGDIYYHLAKQQMENKQGDLNLAKKWLILARDQYRESGGVHSVKYANSLFQLTKLSLGSDHVNKNSLLSSAIACFSEHANARNDVGAWYRLCDLYQWKAALSKSPKEQQDNWKLARSCADTALNLCETSESPSYRIFAMVLNQQAKLYEREKELTKAEACLKHALAMEHRAHPTDPSIAYGTLANLYHRQKEWKKLIALCQHILNSEKSPAAKIHCLHILAATSCKPEVNQTTRGIQYAQKAVALSKQEYIDCRNHGDRNNIAKEARRLIECYLVLCDCFLSQEDRSRSDASGALKEAHKVANAHPMQLGNMQETITEYDIKMARHHTW